MKQDPKNKLEEDRLVSFARVFLAERFPNPDRNGFPPEGALRRLAESPTSADLSITEHLGSCSPCFRQYQRLLGGMKTQRQPMSILWGQVKSVPIPVILGIICLVVIGLSIALWRSNRKEVAHHGTKPSEVANGNGLAKYIPFVLDMRDAAAVRDGMGNTHSPLKLPRMPLHVSVYLPIGSDRGQYTVSLESHGKPVWARSAAAQMQDHRMVLEFEDDLTSLSAGQYTLVLLSKNGLRLRQRVILDEPPKRS